MDKITGKILLFLDEIGIAYKLESIEGNTFLPGLKLSSGTLIIDQEKLLYTGDILHEAGHLAVMPPKIRAVMDDDLPANDLHQGGELMSLAWSYAACNYLNINPAIVFHPQGYKGEAESIIQNFQSGNVFGLPMLQWSGMSYDNKTAAKLGKEAFPAMIEWTCKSRPQ